MCVPGTSSESDPDCSLELSRESGLAGHGAESRTGDRSVRIAEVRMVHDVVALKAEFQIDSLPEFEVLDERSIPVCLPIAADSGQGLWEGADVARKLLGGSCDE